MELYKLETKLRVHIRKMTKIICIKKKINYINYQDYINFQQI